MELITDLLKKDSAHLHDMAEEKFNSGKILNGDYSRTDYETFLTANLKLYQHFEPQLDSFLTDEKFSELNWKERRKLDLLEKDLQVSSTQSNAAEKIENIEEALGVLYVLEGSTLGGNVIRKHLSKLPEFENEYFAFLGCYGENTGKNWTVFKDFLNSKFNLSQYPSILSGVKKAYGLLLAD